jgi:hypothetical protein
MSRFQLKITYQTKNQEYAKVDERQSIDANAKVKKVLELPEEVFWSNFH